MTVDAARLDGDDFAAMVNATARVIDANVSSLSRLDAVSGDGDHGANARRALTQARTLVGELPARSPAAVLDALAEACGETMAGAAGAVFAAFFAGASAAIADSPTVDARALSEILAAGLQRVQRVGGAAVGDKSIVDALAPAVDAAESTSARTADVAAVLSSAATAARAGAEATSRMSASVGRARYAESGGHGFPDPGAVTIALMVESWADTVGERRRIGPG
jgi:dihydroxyacetone kinase-like protein